jgi:hypothetical protein
VLGLVEVVGGEDDRGAAAGERGDERPELAARLRVEAGGGLVEEEQFRVAEDAQRDVEPAALAAGEVAGPGAALLVQPDGGDDLVGIAAAGVVAGEVVHQFLDGDLVEPAGALRHDADAGAPVRSGLLRVLPEDGDLAGVAVAVALEDLDGGRLPGPVRAEQGEDLAVRDVEVEPVDGGHPGVGLAQSADADGGGCRCGHGSTMPVPAGRHEHRAVGSGVHRPVDPPEGVRASLGGLRRRLRWA